MALSELDVGSYHDADVTCVMDGGTLLASRLLQIGEMTGSTGKFVQNDGEILALEICVGAANTGSGSDRQATGELEIRGGRLLTRHLTFGWGDGSTARLRIVGSKLRRVGRRRQRRHRRRVGAPKRPEPQGPGGRGQDFGRR